MNGQFKALLWSFAIHMIMFMLIIGVSHSIPTNKLIVIDFSIEDSQRSEVGNQKSEIRSQKPEIRNQKPEVIEQKPEIKNQEEKIVSPIIPENHPTSNSETQVPLPAPAEKNPLSENGDQTLIANSNIKTDIAVSGGGSGGSLEEGKGRYLKAHFSYIRNMIQRNLTYPKLAREMGWEGRVTVSFIVCESGYVEDIKVVSSSGFETLDKNAVEAVRRTSPFPRPPIRAELIIPITYRLY